MENLESRIAPSPEAGSVDPASPSHLQDLLDFEPVPLRRRTGGLSPEKQRAFVEALADTGIVRAAAARVGVSEQAISQVRRRADARAFDRACEAAHLFGARRLRSVAFERAVQGTLKGHYYHGERISEERVYDNRLLISLLGKTWHLLEPPPGARAVCDDWEVHMDALEQGVEPALPAGEDDEDDLTAREVWQEEDGSWRTSLPPPDGFDGEEEGVWNCVDWYCRTLTPGEEAAMERLTGSLASLEEKRARAAARRDRFFGFAGDDDFSSPKEAETTETSETSGEAEPDEAPLEYKSAFPPVSSSRLAPSGRIREAHAKARRRGGAAPPVPLFPPAQAAYPSIRVRRGEHRNNCPSAPPRLRVNPNRGTSPRPRHIQTAPPRHP